MDDEELRARLRRADPLRDEKPAASWIDDLVEATMDTELDETPRTDRRRWVMPAAAAVAVLAVAGGGYALAGGDDPDRGKDAEPLTELTLVVPAPGSTTQMCMQFGVEALRPMETAFAATATEVESEQVTLEVDRWYKGGDADVVTLTSPADMGVLLEGGVEFTEGERYLVTATGGTVNGCGFSGPWSDEMAAAYDEAF